MNMNQNVMSSNGMTNDQRPTLLKVLCILTFIASGLGILGGVMGAIGMGAMMSAFGGGEMAAGAGIMIAVPGLIFAVAKGYGAWQMWQLKKVGFFIYAGAAVGALVVTPIVTSVALGIGFAFPLWPAVFTALFVGLYYTNLKFLK